MWIKVKTNGMKWEHLFAEELPNFNCSLSEGAERIVKVLELAKRHLDYRKMLMLSEKI